MGWVPEIPDGVTREDYAILLRQQRCSWCAQRRLPNGNDPCLGTLPGVNYACCGHGCGDGYVSFSSGAVLRGAFDDLPPRAWVPGAPFNFRDLP